MNRNWELALGCLGLIGLLALMSWAAYEIGQEIITMDTYLWEMP